MPVMKRTLVTIATTLVAVLLLPTVASARLTEIGTPTAQGKPSCPTNPCLAVSRTTGYQVQGGRVRNPYLVPRRGAIVAFTVALGKPSNRQISFFNTNLGVQHELSTNWAVSADYTRVYGYDLLTTFDINASGANGCGRQKFSLRSTSSTRSCCSGASGSMSLGWRRKPSERLGGS